MGRHAEDLRRYLAEATGRPVVLRMNSNTHSMLNARPDLPGRGIRVSLHRMFLEADDQTLEMLARFMVNPTPEIRGHIRRYIAANTHRIGEGNGAATAGKIPVSGVGRCFNLLERSAVLNREYFEGKLEFAVTWGKTTRPGCRQRHLTLGTWNDRRKLVRLHPILDQPGIPPYFLDFILYHEMVHITVPPLPGSGSRRRIHTPGFKRMERRFRFYREAMAWEKKWIGDLLLYWSLGKDLPLAARDWFPGIP